MGLKDGTNKRVLAKIRRRQRLQTFGESSTFFSYKLHTGSADRRQHNGLISDGLFGSGRTQRASTKVGTNAFEADKIRRRIQRKYFCLSNTSFIELLFRLLFSSQTRFNVGRGLSQNSKLWRDTQPTLVPLWHSWLVELWNRLEATFSHTLPQLVCISAKVNDWCFSQRRQLFMFLV